MIPGPILGLQQMKFASFNYLASVLIDGNKRLRNLQAFGTDVDTNLSEALGHNFPFALSLRCFIHFERNLYSKMHDLGIPKKIADEFVHDVMGSRQGSMHQEGLVGSATVSEIDQKISRVESVWNAREAILWSFCSSILSVFQGVQGRGCSLQHAQKCPRGCWSWFPSCHLYH